MTRKHFNRLAEIVKSIRDQNERQRVGYEIGKLCADSNPNFDWDYWCEGCNMMK